MSTQEEIESWNSIMSGIKEIQEWFPEDVVFIGGVAVFMHSTNNKDVKTEFSHDADFFISMADYADLRDLEEVTPNKRLSKHQIIKNGIDFDVYVENHNDLAVPYGDVRAQSSVIDGVRVASLGHLLVLKVDAFSSRKGSQKGEKDARDVVKIVLCMRDSDVEVARPYMTEKRLNLIEGVSRSSAFDQLSNNNKHEARIIRNRFDSILDALRDDDGATPPARMKI